MGAIYHATQLSLNRPVAIKALPQDLMEDAEANFAARFRHEALTMAKLNHPGIVSVYESGEAGGLLYIVMEFVDGTDVARMIRGSGRLSPSLAADLLSQVCEALEYAHQCKVVHRDLKPANLLVTREGRVKIADFGLARHDDGTRSSLTQTNVAIGTPDFLAPEGWTAGEPLDHRADIYSLGVTLYQMLTGEVPRGLWKMPSVKAGVDPRFDAIVDKAMQPEKEARYQSSGEIRLDLRRIAETQPRTPQTAPEAEPNPAARRRQPLLRPAPAALAGLVLAVLIAAMLFRSGPSKRFVLEFDGKSQCVAVPEFGSIAPTNEITVECWARASALTDGQCFTISNEQDPLVLRGIVSYIDSTSYWDMGRTAPSGRLSAPNVRGAIGNWVHYAFVASAAGNYMRIYTNGGLYASKTGMSPLPRAECELLIGGHRLARFNGQMAEFRVWSLARSPEEIEKSFRTRLAGDEKGLLLYYPLDEGTGAVAFNHARATGPSRNARILARAEWTKTPEPTPERLGPKPRTPQTLTVTNLDDRVESAGTLRQLLKEAGQGDTVRFAPGLAGKTLFLLGAIEVLEKEVTIDASGQPGGMTIAALGEHRMFDVSKGATLNLKAITLTNGFSDRGGAIHSQGFLSLTDCEVAGCAATVNGGAIYSLESRLTMIRCKLSGNKAEYGGAVWAGVCAVANLTNCLLVGNQATAAGGGIFLDQAQADMERCGVTGNSAGNGGGIFNRQGLLALLNSPVTNNVAPADPNLASPDGKTVVLGPNPSPTQ